MDFDIARKSDFRLWKLFRDFDFLIRQNHAALKNLKILLATITWQAHVLRVENLDWPKLDNFEKKWENYFGKIIKPRFYLLTVEFRFLKMSHFNNHIIMKSWCSRISLPWPKTQFQQFQRLFRVGRNKTTKYEQMFDYFQWTGSGHRNLQPIRIKLIW